MAEMETLAEVMCPPYHREGVTTSIIGKPPVYGPRTPCLVHQTYAQNALSWLASVLADDATVEVVGQVQRDHTIACTGVGEVSCRGCRKRGWMPWSEYRAHLSERILAALSAHLTAPARAGDTSGEEAGRG